MVIQTCTVPMTLSVIHPMSGSHDINALHMLYLILNYPSTSHCIVGSQDMDSSTYSMPGSHSSCDSTSNFRFPIIYRLSQTQQGSHKGEEASQSYPGSHSSHGSFNNMVLKNISPPHALIGSQGCAGLYIID